MSNILIRTLIKEILLVENHEEINTLYQNWRNNFQNDVKKIKNTEYKKIFLLNPPPMNYSDYDDWLNKKVDLFSTINDIINILSNTVVKFKNTVKNNMNTNNSNFLNQGFLVFNASSIIKDPGLLMKAKSETKYCEELIAEILRQSGVSAERTKGEYDLYDIESDQGIFEVKSIWSDKGIRCGVTSESIAINFRDLLVRVVDQILNFNTNIDNINLNNKEFLDLKSKFKNKIEELLNEKGKGSPNLNIYDLRKGNLPIPRSNLVKDLAHLSERLRDILNQYSKDNENLQINGSNIELNTPAKKSIYYEVIKKLKNLGVSIEVDENDFNYVSSIIETNLEQKIIEFMRNELQPRKSFRSDLRGLFVVLDNTNDPKIAYIDEKYINDKLSYQRTTIDRGSMRTKFTLNISPEFTNLENEA